MALIHVKKQVLLMAVALLPTTGLGWAAAAHDIKQAMPSPIDKAAWVSAGLKFGWTGVDDTGITFFHEKEEPGALPAFRFSRNYKAMNLTTLPVINAQFGLLLDDPGIRDSFLQGINRFQQLRILCLRYAGIGNMGMKLIGQLNDLEALEVSMSPNTEKGEATDSKEFNQGLGHLAALIKLEVLNLSNTSCGDEGINHFGEMRQMRVLNLQQTKVTDVGLIKVATFKRLQVLNLLYTPITEKGIKELARLTELRSMTVGGPTITDAELTEIAKLRQLKSLVVVLSEVGREGLKKLATLEKLQRLELIVPITDDDLRELILL